MYKLAICIATYNRDEFIERQLNLLEASGLIDEEIGIYVLDGGSSDNTAELVSNFSKINPNINLISQSFKGGVDQDFDRVIFCANAEYVWPMCDDDDISIEYLPLLLNFLKRNKPNLLIHSAEVLDYENDCNVLSSNTCNPDYPTFYKCSTLDEICTLAGTHLSYIGCMIIKKTLWDHKMASSFFGTRFGHLGLIGSLPSKLTGLYFTSQISVKIRAGNAEWTDVLFKIWYLFWPKIVDGMQVSIAAKNCLNQIGTKSLLKKSMFHRALGVQFDNSVTNEFKAYYGFGNTILARIIFSCPKIIFVILFTLIHRKRKNTLALYHLKRGNFSTNKWKSQT